VVDLVKGPDPEAVTVGNVDGITYAFVGLERVGGVMIFDLSDPRAPELVDYIVTRNFTVPAALEVDGDDLPNRAAGDLAPEGLELIPTAHGPTGRPLLLIANEVSGTTSVVELDLFL
jgi:hypothetical protein